MSGDDKPSRFAMISEEMINPPELAKVEISPDPGGLTLGGEVTVCPRCKLGAFELAPTISYQVRIICLGCPPPAPTYFIPEGTEVRVNPYRCCRCGNRARVTMTLSEVNLHCRACRQLTLHTRQVPAPTPTPTYTAEFFERKPNQKPEPVGRIPGFAKSILKWDNFAWDDLTFGISFQPETKSQDADKLVERMRVALKLENFFDYAQKRRLMNAELVVQGAYDGNDIARGTGRTTRGLLEALVQCIIDNKRKIMVRGGSIRAEMFCFEMLKDILISIANSSDRDLRMMLVLVKVSRYSDDQARMYRDAITYVDHTCNER